MAERWLPVPGYAGIYEVSDEGRVRSLPRTHITQGCRRGVAGRILKLNKDSRGYTTAHLYRGGRHTRKPFWVAILVAEVFIGPRPPGLEVCHNDGNKSNNRLGNLRYDTNTANKADKKAHGTHREGESINFAKLTRSDVVTIKTLLVSMTHAAIAAQFKVSRPTVSLIASGKTWKHV